MSLIDEFIAMANPETLNQTKIYEDGEHIFCFIDRQKSAIFGSPREGEF